MSHSEFDIIARYFDQPGLRAEVGGACSLGIGDDCALIRVAPGHQLAISMDLLSAGVHFPADADAASIACRALAVNLSDLAAMGALPVGFTLGLSLPDADENWLAAFSRGLAQAAGRYACPLLGGDLVRGPLGISIQVHGELPEGRGLRRDGAHPGDLLYVSGTLGDAGLALDLILGRLQAQHLSEAERDSLLESYYHPEPRLNLGRALLERASAAIDISDGLAADVGHIAKRSGVAVMLSLADLPLSPVTARVLGEEQARLRALTAGDDYELAFTVPAAASATMQELAESLGIRLSCIGAVVAGSGVHCLDASGAEVPLGRPGYQHFNAAENGGQSTP